MKEIFEKVGCVVVKQELVTEQCYLMAGSQIEVHDVETPLHCLGLYLILGQRG